MNIRPLAILFLSSSFCLAQAATPAKTTPSTKPATPTTGSSQTKQTPSDPDKAQKPAAPAPNLASSVGPDEAVITIPGACPAGTAADNCVTKITRSDFERLLNAMNPNIPVEARRSIASSYGQLVALASQAQKMGLDKDPTVQLQMHVQAMSLMAQALQKKTVENSKPTQQEIEDYYKQNIGKYEELNLRRIVVLKSSSSDLKPEQLKALAEQIRERAAAGEDPDKLQVEAYKSAKSAGTPPSTSLGWKKKGGIDPRHEPAILALKEGGVSDVMEDGQAYYIYKVDAKRAVPLETAQKEIESELQRDKAKKALQAITENAKPQLNDAYFGPAEPKAPSLQNPPPK